jgi:hypothetical protein
MNPNDIKLNNIDKQFEYEKYSRLIDDLSGDELKNIAKAYFKLYLKQQEVMLSLPNIDL